MKFPIRLFCPAEDYTKSQLLRDERELELCKYIASRLSLAIRLDQVAGKLYLGRLAKPASGSIESKVKALAQTNSKSCGQTSCAMAINTLAGGSWSDKTFNARYAFELIKGLREQTPGWTWEDCNFTPALWGRIEQAIDAGAPTIIALNGPQFSPSGYGHILLIVGYTATHVRLADPATGTFRTVAKDLVETCPPHRQGKWAFVPSK